MAYRHGSDDTAPPIIRGVAGELPTIGSARRPERAGSSAERGRTGLHGSGSPALEESKFGGGFGETIDWPDATRVAGRGWLTRPRSRGELSNVVGEFVVIRRGKRRPRPRTQVALPAQRDALPHRPEQFIAAYGLRNVVIHSGFQATFPVPFHRMSGDADHRDVRVAGFRRPNFTGCLQSAHSGI